MENEKSKPAVLSWWVGGLLLGLIMILAVAVKKPLGVSTQFVVVEGVALNKVAPDYVENHPRLKKEKYHKLGYGWWLDVGLIVGAVAAAIFAGRWKIRSTCEWSRANGGLGRRLLLSLVGGFLLLLGARMAGGCTSGQFLGGWAQLSLSAVPFTVGLFVFGMIAAKIFYPKVPGSPSQAKGGE